MIEGLHSIRYGKDAQLEAQADEWLRRDVGDNKRSSARDIEKMSYELGLVAFDELEHYDPTNDWDSFDEPWVHLYADISEATPSLCSGDDGNIRARSREDPNLGPGVWGRAGEEERRGLGRHVGDAEDWGSPWEEIPQLGVNEITPGVSKVCTKCKLRKRLECFAPDRRNKKDGLHSWCIDCHREHKRLTYEKRKTRRSKRRKSQPSSGGE